MRQRLGHGCAGYRRGTGSCHPDHDGHECAVSQVQARLGHWNRSTAHTVHLQFEAGLSGRQIGILASYQYLHTKWGPAHRQPLRPQMSNRCISGLYHLEK